MDNTTPEYRSAYNLSGILGMAGYGGQAGVPYAPGTNYAPAGSTYSTAVAPGSQLGAMTTPSAVAPDPYAAYGGKEAYDSKRSGYQAQKTGIIDSANQAAGASGAQYKSGILDYLDSLKQGQRAIDSDAVAAEQARTQGARDVRDFVGRGIESGGVMLANRNASTSSAGDAIARAYAMLGGRQMSQIGQQYAGDMNEVGEKQTLLDEGVVQQTRHNRENQENVVNNLVSDVTGKLSALDAQIAGASLPDRINIEQEKERIRQTALSQLQQFDPLFAEGVAGTKASSREARMGKAAELLAAGQAASPYEFSTEAPAEFQGTGGYNYSLPLFTLPRRRQS